MITTNRVISIAEGETSLKTKAVLNHVFFSLLVCLFVCFISGVLLDFEYYRL